MPPVSSSIPNLINGVSQQPSTLRLASQAELSTNCYPSIVEGMRRRQPTRHLAELVTGTLASSAYIHTINRDLNERYVATIINGDLYVHDIDGTAKTVNFPNGKGYLSATDPQSAFKALTVQDFTFLVNTDQTVAMHTDLSTSRGVEALVFVKQANFQTDYEVVVDAVTATHTTGSTGALSTVTIADDLKTQLSTGLGGNYTVTREASVIHVKRNDGVNITVKIEDSRADTQMTLTKDTVQNFSDLPTVAPDGYIARVLGDETSDADDFYVVFVPTNTGDTFGSGVWEETVAPGIEYKFDPGTMPHVLIREADGTFTFKEATWGERIAGDADSSPAPSFVGQAIQDVFYHKNRLMFLSGENLIGSRAGEFFDFFASTVTTLVDSDPIDVAASSTKAAVLKHAVEFNGTVLAFSDQTQFTLNKVDILTPETAQITGLTNYEGQLLASPVATGKTVMFAFNRGDYDGVREFFVDTETESSDAADITAHVPRYIPSGIFKMATSTGEDVCVVLTNGNREAMFVYKYHWSGQEKLQSAWVKYEFQSGCEIINADFIDTTCYLVVQRTDGVYLEAMDFEPSKTDANHDFEFMVDRKITETDTSMVYDSGTNKTTITLPYALDGVPLAVTRSTGAGGEKPAGTLLPVSSYAGDQLVLNGDRTAQTFYIGVEFESRYRFSEVVVRETSRSGGSVVIETGRLQLLSMTMQFDRTGYFEVHVTPLNRDTRVTKYTARVIGSAKSKVGEVSLEDGKLRVPVRSRADRATVDIVSSSYLPFNMTAAGWEGAFTIKSRRI